MAPGQRREQRSAAINEIPHKSQAASNVRTSRFVDCDSVSDDGDLDDQPCWPCCTVSLVPCRHSSAHHPIPCMCATEKRREMLDVSRCFWIPRDRSSQREDHGRSITHTSNSIVEVYQKGRSHSYDSTPGAHQAPLHPPCTQAAHVPGIKASLDSALQNSRSSVRLMISKDASRTTSIDKTPRLVL